MAKQKKDTARIYDARPDTLDFRDKMYTPTLFEVPVKIDLDTYKAFKVPILDQGKEGACTGFGLATVANYLLRKRKVVPDPAPVSPRMLYEMAKRYDEWTGENYSGSSARGAMKGWHKHGVCEAECWPYKVDSKKREERLNASRITDALKRPLGAYFRVNHKDLVAMHTAMAEVGILYATSNVHTGWQQAGKDGIIKYSGEQVGGHAFAIVAYDDRGFWIQNSWGKSWGKDGFGLVSYDDWLLNATDVWVARLGAPVLLFRDTSAAIAHSAAASRSKAYSYPDLRPHIISIGNDGALKPGGDIGTSYEEVETIFTVDFDRVTKGWKKKRLLLYAHGGLVSEDAAVQRLAEYRATLLEAEVYPISFIWHTDYWTTTTNLLQDALKRRKPEGFIDAAKDFMLDRLDDALEPVARVLTGKLQWDEMKENALKATSTKAGGAAIAAGFIAGLAKQYGEDFELHVIGHSAGSIFHAPLVQLLTTDGTISSGPLKGRTGYDLNIRTCILWAPAITVNDFKQYYLEPIQAKAVQRFALFILSDKAEQDDNCAGIYHKSLLYLVSNAFEETARIPVFRNNGTPVFGMQKFVEADADLKALFKKPHVQMVIAPNNEPAEINHSSANSHGSFDDDIATVKAALARMLDTKIGEDNLAFNKSASSLQDRRDSLNAASF